jgi:hypothetical protein
MMNDKGVMTSKICGNKVAARIREVISDQSSSPSTSIRGAREVLLAEYAVLLVGITSSQMVVLQTAAKRLVAKISSTEKEETAQLKDG